MSDRVCAWFAATTGPFLRHHPFYAAVLARTVPEENPAVAAMGGSADGPGFRLHVNPTFVTRRRNRKYVTGVLQHEIHHVVLGHVSDPRFLALPHPDLAEIAMEISANENIRSPLPGDPPTWQKYESLGIRPGQST